MTAERDGSPPIAIAASAWGSLLVLAAAPVALWHRVIAGVISSFHWQLTYLTTELGPWLLFLASIAFLVPVALSAGRDPESRLYPRARRAYFSWGVVLYLMGCVLAIEVAELWRFAH